MSHEAREANWRTLGLSNGFLASVSGEAQVHVENMPTETLIGKYRQPHSRRLESMLAGHEKTGYFVK